MHASLKSAVSGQRLPLSLKTRVAASGSTLSSAYQSHRARKGEAWPGNSAYAAESIGTTSYAVYELG